MNNIIIKIFTITIILICHFQNAHAQQKIEYGYNYGAVCIFVEAMRTFLIPKPQNILPQGSRLIAAYGGKGNVRKAYNFSKGGLGIEFITINGIVNVKSVSLSGEAIPEIWRRKENIVSLFEITNPSSDNKIDIACDGTYLVIEYNDDHVYNIIGSVTDIE